MAQTQPPLTPSLVFVPNLRVDRGMGHLRRCLNAARSAGRGAAVFWSADEALTQGRPVFDRITVQALAEAAGVELCDGWPEGSPVTVVADLQTAGLEAFGFLRARSQRLIGWDTGGAARGRFPFLVDSLPHDTKPDPNVRLPGLLGLPFSSVPKYGPIQRILAVFGGADPAGLTLRFLAMVQALRNKGRWPYTLTVVRGPLSRFTAPPGVEVVDSPSNLTDLLRQADLTVASWGLTALESLAEGTPVLLLNPTGYHERLSRKAGLPTFGVRSPRTRAFLSGLRLAPDAARSAREVLLHPPEDAGRYFAEFRGSDGRCPVCRTSGHPVFARTEHKSYHRCLVCGMEYLSFHRLPEKEYAEAYFFDDYQKQYGKTYLEDFAHIQGLGRQRLAFLGAVLGKRTGLGILDVGCAYGPFLAAAAEAGHRPFGVDIAEGAVKYVAETLSFPAVRASFSDFRWEESFPSEPRPDAVTLWYVIEHFADLDSVLRKANTLLPVGGVLAFSTPNGRGITRSFQPEKFWSESPDDHFSIWNPGNVRSVLGRFGFKVAALRITGRHPERFPGLKKTSGILYSIVTRLDRWFGWGDTFEVYARKSKELP